MGREWRLREKITRRPCAHRHIHTHISISYPYFPSTISSPSTTPLKTFYASFLPRRRGIGDWVSTVKPNPRESASRSRWNVKSGSTTADVTNDRSHGRAVPLPCKPLQRLKHRGCEDIPRFEVWIESDTPARRALHSGFAFVSCLWEEMWVSVWLELGEYFQSRYFQVKIKIIFFIILLEI
jgi:hypothetical protein